MATIRSNDALRTNPPAGAQQLSEHGSDWLWAVTAIYAASFLGVYVLSHGARFGERVFHYMYGVALLVGAVCYFSMAADLGFRVVATSSLLDRGVSRQIFYAKYINWAVSFPAATVSAGLLSGVSWATIAHQVLLGWFWVLAYLAAALTPSVYKWGFFAFGTAAWLLLAVTQVVLDGRRSAKRIGVGRDYALLAGWTNLLWLLYPIAFGLSDGGNVIGVTAGAVFFGVLDVLLLPVLACATLVLSRGWDYRRLGMAFTQDGRVVVPHATFPDKSTAAAPEAVVPV